MVAAIQRKTDLNELTPAQRAKESPLINRVEETLVRHGGGPCDKLCPVKHFLVPGFYVRQITMPKGVTLTSKIHKTRHPFHISEGKVSVYSDNGGIQYLCAPFWGMTEPGTRRILKMHETTVWTTFHATEKESLEEIEEEVIEPHEIPTLESIRMKDQIAIIAGERLPTVQIQDN